MITSFYRIDLVSDRISYRAIRLEMLPHKKKFLTSLCNIRRMPRLLIRLHLSKVGQQGEAERLREWQGASRLERCQADQQRGCQTGDVTQQRPHSDIPTSWHHTQCREGHLWTEDCCPLNGQARRLSWKWRGQWQYVDTYMIHWYIFRRTHSIIMRDRLVIEVKFTTYRLNVKRFKLPDLMLESWVVELNCETFLMLRLNINMILYQQLRYLQSDPPT